MGNNPPGKQIVIKKVSSTMHNKAQSDYLAFRSYYEYFSVVNDFTQMFQSLISRIVMPVDSALLERQILNNSIAFLSWLTAEELFDVAMTIYHRIGSVYGNSISYTRTELSKITFSLISKHLAVQNPLQEALISTIADNIIKRINYFTDEYPFRLRNIIDLIQEKCIYVFRYDKLRNVNVFIEPFVLGYNKAFTYMDYVVYVVFLIESVMPSLKAKCRFNERINIVINFNLDEVNAEMISYLLHWINMFYPLVVNKFFIVNFDEESLLKNVAFKEELEMNDYFKRVKILPSDFSRVLLADIEEDNLPVEYGGKGEVRGVDFAKAIKSNEELSEYFIRLVFKESDYASLEKYSTNTKENSKNA